MLTSSLNVGRRRFERAKIRIELGSISELRFGQYALCGVANLARWTSDDYLKRSGSGTQRVDPDPKMIASLDYVMDRINYWDEEKTRLYLDIEAECRSLHVDLSYSRPI